MYLNLEKKKVTLPNGETIAYVDKGAGAKTLVLIHGNFSSCYHYEPLYKLIEEDYRVIAMDLRGYGDSSYNNGFDSLHELADDVVALLKELKVEKAVVAGWSLGGCVAMSLTARYPEMVEKLILIASGSVKGYPVFCKDEKGLPMVGKTYETKEALSADPVNVLPMLLCQQKQDAAMMENIWNLTIYTSASKKKPEEDAGKVFIQETLKQRNLVDADWALMRFNISDQPSFYAQGEDIAKNITCPVLAVNGRQDVTVPEIMTAENRQFIAGIEQKYYEDCGHSIIVDEPVQLWEDMKAFIG